jgi:putative serine protease PepD
VTRLHDAGIGPPWRLGALIAVLSALVGGVVGGVIVYEVGPSSAPSPTAPCPATVVVERVLPSVVTVSATQGQNASTGSGEIISSTGYILTNNHVISVAAGGGSVRVLFSDTRSAPAVIVGRDPQTDLAVLKVSGQAHLKPIPLGASTTLKVGEPVIAFGAPLGLSSTVTTGVVSALGRTIEVPGDDGRSALLVDAIQTDAAINPGNSGGALVDCKGSLIGVPSAGASVPSPSGQQSAGSVGLGFAIPIDLATVVSNEIIATGSVTHAYFGLQTTPISASATHASGATAGLYVVQVVTGSPAQDAGLRTGDVVTAIEKMPAVSADQLAALTLTRKPGDKVSLTYERQGREATTTVTLGEQP